ncbi:MAG: SMP-30/gluconolactonase/LRE family protein [Oscillospiraceae bacterium]|nr:SMP-30/gluconolactonase/LRE family protein [Oscillospiraceae bacterium]
MVNYQARRLQVPALKLGEGPCWDEKTGSLIYVDISAGALHRFFPKTGAHTMTALGQMVGAAVPFENGRVAVALSSGIYLLNDSDPDDPFIESFLCRPDSMTYRERFNDGKLDPAGRFVVGTMPLGKPGAIGSLYSVEQDGRVFQLFDGVQISNGLAWTADGKTMYFNDTPTLKVFAFDYDLETGSVSNRRVVIEIAPGIGRPDGMCIDSKGMLWVAHWEGSMIGRYDPAKGKLIAKIELPERNVTSCCFGPEGELYITTADDSPGSVVTAAKGGVYVAEVEL